MARDPCAPAVDPVTPDRWADLEVLFGDTGACGGCWCQYWRRPAAEYEAGTGAGNRRALREQVETGEPPGLLAYTGDDPVGWIAVEPREAFVRLERSRILAPVDDAAVWSVPWFYVAPSARDAGLSVTLLEAAVDYVAHRGGVVLEGYPVEASERRPPAFVWTGLARALEAAGFEEVARRSATRPVMRRVIAER